MTEPSEHDVAALSDLSQCSLLAVEVGETSILLARDGDAVLAVGATCPHAGAPLVEGVRSGSRVICPWHKATFCLKTGALTDPLRSIRCRVTTSESPTGGCSSCCPR